MQRDKRKEKPLKISFVTVVRANRAAVSRAKIARAVSSVKHSIGPSMMDRSGRILRSAWRHRNTSSLLNAYLYTYMYVYIFKNIYLYIHKHTHTHTHTHIHTNVETHMWTHIRTHAHTHAHARYFIFYFIGLSCRSKTDPIGLQPQLAYSFSRERKKEPPKKEN